MPTERESVFLELELIDIDVCGGGLSEERQRI